MNSTQTIVSPLWLRENLNNPEVKIIDCRFRLGEADWGFQQYSQNHIPHSYYLNLDQDLSSPVEKHGGRHPLPDIKLLAKKLTNIGIVKDKTKVIIYDDQRFAFAARLWWLIRYLGHQQVFILDGGFSGWLNEDLPTEQTIPSTQDHDDDRNQNSFIPVIQEDLLVDLDYVKNKQKQNDRNAVIIDARSNDRYQGKVEPIDPIAGSIPNAKNLFWQEMTTPEGKLKSLDELKQLWNSFQDYPEIIMYCGSGVTACVNLFALTTIGIDHGKLYLGGWSDYCSYPEHFT